MEVLLQDVSNLVIAFWRWTTHDPVAFFTFVLALSTIGLWIITWRGIRNQSNDIRILQRAYLSADLVGVRSMSGAVTSSPGFAFVGYIVFRNVGHLPARKVSWFIDIKLSISWEEKDFPIPSDERKFDGKNVIAPGSTMKVGSGGQVIIPGQSGFLYVWGQVRYDDGFGQPRTTNFCHRYNCGALRAITGGFVIDVEDGRYHEFGNDAD